MPPAQRLHAIDAAWMAGFAVVSLLLTVLTGGWGVFAQPQAYLAAVTVVVLYVLGFSIRDRATAVIASALLATSPLFAATQIESVRDSLFVLFTVSALAASACAAYTTWAELLAVVIAAVATIIRPEGFLLGAVLLGFAIADKRPGGVVGLVIYLGVTFAGIAGMALYVHQHFPTATLSLNPAPFLSLINAQTIVLTFFVIALLGDLAEPARRTRWKMAAVWSVLFLCVESLFQFSGFSFAAGPFQPILFLLAAGGISRILPVVAGDFPNPTIRYGVAVLFVGALIGTRAHAEWPQAKRLLARHDETPVPVRDPRLVTRDEIHTYEGVGPHNPRSSDIWRSRRQALTDTGSSHPPTTASTGTRTPQPPKAQPVTAPKPIQVAKAAPKVAIAIGGARQIAAKVPTGVVHHYVFVPAAALKPQKSSKSTPPASTKPAPKIVDVPGIPHSLAVAAAGAGVATYWMRGGHMVARSPWAVQWDIAHKPKPAVKVAAKAPAKPVTKVAAKTTVKPVTKVAAKPLMRSAVKASTATPKTAQKPAAKTASTARPKAVSVHPTAPSIAKTVAKPAPKPAPKTAAHVNRPANTLADQAAAAGVPMYYVMNGRRVPRNIWAIKWDIAHRPARRTVATPAHAAASPHRTPAHAAASHPATPRVAAVKAHATTPAHVVAAPHSVARPAYVAHPRAVAHPAYVARPYRRWAPRRIRHRSIWAIRWQQAHPGRR